MSDSPSILGSVADTGKDVVKELGSQTTKAAASIVKGAFQQVVGTKSEEEIAKEQADKLATHQRIKKIEAEIAQIRAQRSQEQSQMEQVRLTSSDQSTGSDDLKTSEKKQMDEASRQAVGKAELGRGFKG